jgi:hypothetical protein
VSAFDRIWPWRPSLPSVILLPEPPPGRTPHMRISPSTRIPTSSVGAHDRVAWCAHRPTCHTRHASPMTPPPRARGGGRGVRTPTLGAFWHSPACYNVTQVARYGTNWRRSQPAVKLKMWYMLAHARFLSNAKSGTCWHTLGCYTAMPTAHHGTNWRRILLADARPTAISGSLWCMPGRLAHAPRRAHAAIQRHASSASAIDPAAHVRLYSAKVPRLAHAARVRPSWLAAA